MVRWVSDEFRDLNFGDKRVNAKGIDIISTLSRQPGVSIPTAFNTWSETKSCYEFFANGKVTAQKILNPHKNATLKRISAEKCVLLPTDTTALNYTNKPSIDGPGNIGNVNKEVFIHPLLAITPERLCLGIVEAKIWARIKTKTELSDHQMYSMPIAAIPLGEVTFKIPKNKNRPERTVIQMHGKLLFIPKKIDGDF